MISTSTFLQQIEASLNDELPSWAAQEKMDPMPKGARKFDDNRKTPRESAVLILLAKGQKGWHFPLIQRPKYDGVHSGQVALPGGKAEESDNSLIETALRESEEEIGVDRQSVTVLGQLSQIYIPPSNFNILPIVGYVNQKPIYTREEREVEAIYEPTTTDLINPLNRQQRDVNVSGGFKMKVPCFMFDQTLVWGATAMILSEFATIIENINHE